MPDQRNLPVARNTTALAVPNADVSGEISRAGIAFGDLVQQTGQAVAETQNLLNDTSARTATALSNTLVDVIAVQEKVYDDQGNISEMRSHNRRLPLINFIDPVFYEWTNVRLQRIFYAREFADSSTAATSNYTSKEKSGQGGLFIILGGGRTTYDYSSTTTELTREQSQDISVGRIRANAILKPRPEIGVPKPTQVLRGPRLVVTEGEIQDVREGASGPITERTMSILLELSRRDGTAIAGKAMSIDSEGASWSVVGSGTTDSEGRMTIQLHRYFEDEEVDTTPIDVVVTARLGLIHNSTTVTF